MKYRWTIILYCFLQRNVHIYPLMYVFPLLALSSANWYYFLSLFQLSVGCDNTTSFTVLFLSLSPVIRHSPDYFWSLFFWEYIFCSLLLVVIYRSFNLANLALNSFLFPISSTLNLHLSTYCFLDPYRLLAPMGLVFFYCPEISVSCCIFSDFLLLRYPYKGIFLHSRDLFKLST